MQHKKDGAAWDTAPNYPWRYSVVWFRVFLMLNRILSIYLFISIFIRTDGMSVNDGIHRDCSVYIEVVPEADFGGLRKEKRFCQYPAFY